MTPVGYTVVSLVHLSGVLAFHYTANQWFLLLPAAHAALGIISFMIAAAFVLSRMHDDDINFKPETENIGIRFLSQVSVLITAYQLYLIDYAFFAGIITMTSVSLIMTIYYIKIGKEKTNE